MSSLADAETLPVVVRLVTFWQDGFSISHLPSSSSASQDANEIEEETEITFYSYQEKENEILLQTILSGHAPLGPLQVQLGQRVELKILDNKNQKYTLKKKETKLLPFSGQGSRLGA